MLGDAFIPVLTSVFNAPPTSPLSDADPIQIADFLVHLSAPQEPNVRTCLRNSMTSSVGIYILCKCSKFCSQEDSVHDSLAETVANAVLSEPDNSLLTRVYCRALTHMQLTDSNQVYRLCTVSPGLSARLSDMYICYHVVSVVLLCMYVDVCPCPHPLPVSTHTLCGVGMCVLMNGVCDVVDGFSTYRVMQLTFWF